VSCLPCTVVARVGLCRLLTRGARSIVRQLAGQLDLNSLHDLSRSCRQFRANLLEYRDQLVRHTLHCVNEGGDGVVRSAVKSPLQLTSGKIGRCARDMVGECQRCAVIVCRVYMAVSCESDRVLTVPTRTAQ
jgi:hypothetical protein